MAQKAKEVAYTELFPVTRIEVVRFLFGLIDTGDLELKRELKRWVQFKAWKWAHDEEAAYFKMIRSLARNALATQNPLHLRFWGKFTQNDSGKDQGKGGGYDVWNTLSRVHNWTTRGQSNKRSKPLLIKYRFPKHLVIRTCFRKKNGLNSQDFYN